MNTENPEIERSRIRQVFRYLEALNQLRNAPKRLIHEQPWVLWFRDISQHDSIRKGTIGDVQQSESASDGNVTSTSEDLVLKVCRPKTTQPPIPPEMIKSWLNEGWEQIDGNVEVFSSKNEVASEGQTIIIRFEDNPERPLILDSWKRLRDEWAQNERPAREALKLFEKLYELYGQIEREGERVELILGDGVLNWRRAEGGVNHPILLKRLQLEFNPNIPEFTLTETGHPTELYSALFRTMSELSGGMVGRFRDELEKGSYHPLGGDDTSGFLRRIVAQLHANGQFVGFDQLQGEQDFPRIIRSPVIFMRNRNLGFANALDAVLDDIKKRTDFPHSLVNVVGIEAALRDVDPCPSTKWMGNGNENVEILLSKPANVEQLHIAERLSQYGCVVVQGPPGTGKTHTIGNLVGHLLAEGKSVLVTSHTTKALRVLREKVADPLQPLCVSVLESDEQAFHKLQCKFLRTTREESKVINTLAEAVRQRDPAKYETAYGRLAEILGRRQTLDRRHALLKKLDTVAPTWAAMISHRQAPHATDEPPGNAEDAWLWRQLNDMLDAHSKISPEDIQQKIDSLNDALKHTTTELIDRLAWAAQARRTTLQQRQALMGWEQVIRRIGKGTGKRVVRLETEARSLMDKCRTAVPVWIMPLTRVVDNFNPASTRFDVVIIDEASQCDVMALIALYMAKQVVIVGDHEQVSPDAVGQNVSEVQHLIDEHP